MQLDLFLEQYGAMPDIARTALASSFGATLEMAREGLVEISQAEPFAPIYMRRREAGCRVAARLDVTQLSGRSRTLPKNKGTGMVPPKLNVVPQDSAPDDAREDDAVTEPGVDPSEMLAHEGWRGLPSNVAQLPSADRREQLRILEALLFAASEPIGRGLSGRST